MVIFLTNSMCSNVICHFGLWVIVVLISIAADACNEKTRLEQMCFARVLRRRPVFTAVLPNVQMCTHQSTHMDHTVV